MYGKVAPGGCGEWADAGSVDEAKVRIYGLWHSNKVSRGYLVLGIVLGGSVVDHCTA